MQRGFRSVLTSLLFAGLLSAFLSGLLGCSNWTTPVASALDEPEANRVMLALDRAHVAATKEIDTGAEGKFRVVVGSEDAARALAALRSEELPRRKATSVEKSGSGSLVPSPAAEHAQISLATAAELERSLESIDGVLSARVHLNLPSPEPLRDGPREKSTASVLIAHRGSTPPIAEAAVQRLVAGGAAGLAAGDVAVVMVPRGALATDPNDERGLARLGPFGVARGSLRAIQVTLGGLLVVLAALAGALLLTGSRLTRLRASLEGGEGVKGATHKGSL